MNNIELNSKWEEITSFKDINGYQALRISSTCIPDIFLAVDADGYRCLLLFLPEGIRVRTKGKTKDNLMLSYFPGKNFLSIKLKDFDFNDLFNDLVLSIYSKVKTITNSVLASEEFIAAFNKWSVFFDDIPSNKLTQLQIQGLFGELFVLDEYLTQASSLTINATLRAWKGLYDAANDFEFFQKNVEVKTKEENKLFVKISSEFQLERELDKGLELKVISVTFDLTDGKSIHDLIKAVIQCTRSKGGDLGIIYHALSQKGLTVEALKEYDNYRFVVKNSKTYDCTIIGFPKLSSANIPNEISSLTYDLRVSTLSEFLIEERKY